MHRSVAVLFLALISSLILAQRQPYVIDRFESQITLNADATIGVTETISVTFNEPRRGIFRTIPVIYDLRTGQQRAVAFDLGSVSDEHGVPYTIMVTHQGNDIKIRIGDADVTLPPGTKKTYILNYSVYGAINWHGEEAAWEPWTELYWNVTGDEWDTSITETFFRVTFPESDGGQVRGRAFAGRLGSTDNVVLESAGETGDDNPAKTAIRLSSNDFEGKRYESLAPNEGLTLVLGVPQTSVPQPTAWEDFVRRIRENLALFTPLIVTPIMGLWWLRKGRDFKDGPTTVHFEPPEGNLPAAETGALIDERVDQRDIAAGIMSLCVKGYLTIEVTNEGGVFKKREYALLTTKKTDPTGLSVFEARLYDRICLGGDFVTRQDLSEYVAPAITQLKNDIYEELVRRGYYSSNPNMLRGAAIFLGLLLSAAVAFILLKASIIDRTYTAVIGGVLASIPACFFGWHMPRRTYPGTLARRQAHGLYEMMRHRKNYMAWVVEKQPDGLKYEEYLPYAVAFNLVEQWNDAFKDIVKEPPSWYHDPYGGPFLISAFSHDVSSMASTMASAAGTPPRSSGASGGSSGFSSGGGGFSGGGFGGGGGGSW